MLTRIFGLAVKESEAALAAGNGVMAVGKDRS
jgi:hypothetical protein